MKQYLDLLQKIVDYGDFREDRTKVGTKALFGPQLEFNLQDGFPLITTKKIFTKAVIHELLWFIKGSTNIKYLVDNNVHIWDEWADENGELGPVYGAQWRGGYDGNPDQLAEVIRQIKSNPANRRMIVNSWNVKEIPFMNLPPCHALYQFFVTSDGYLDCKMYQRSADMFLGTPFNIASYALLTMMVAQVCGLKPRRFIHTFGDTHIYMNHLEQVKEQLSREPRSLPIMRLNQDITSIEDFKFEDFSLEGYNPYPAIKAEIAV